MASRALVAIALRAIARMMSGVRLTRKSVSNCCRLRLSNKSPSVTSDRKKGMMMFRPSRLAAPLTLICWAVFALGVEAQSYPTSPPQERLFLLYLLEHLYRETWPDESSVQEDVQDIEAFVARHKIMADEIKRHIEKSGYGKDLSGMYFSYGEMLDTLVKKADGVIKEHKEVQEKYIWSKKRQIIKEWVQQIRGNQAAAADEIAGSIRGSLDASGGDPFAVLFSGLTTALIENAKVQSKNAAVTRAAVDEWKDHWNKIKDEYGNKTKEMRKGFIKAIADERQKQCKIVAEVAEMYAKGRSWKEEDLRIDALVPLTGNETGRERDVFRAARLIRNRKPPVGIEEAQFYLKNANDYLAVIRLVPESDVYNFVRADLYREAGVQANRASAKQLGTASFRTGAPTAAGPVGVQAWEKHFFYLRKDRFDGDTLYQIMLAHMYAGQFDRAYAILSANKRYWPINPVFLYDASRVCSILADRRNLAPAAQQRYSTESAKLLGLAVNAGFLDLPGAKETRDLEKMRTMHKKWFEAFIDGQIPPALAFGDGKDSPILGDPFMPDSVWAGSGLIANTPNPKIKYVMTVTERKGTSFKATLDVNDGQQKREIEGKIDKGAISWKREHVTVLVGNANAPCPDHSGTISGNKISLTFTTWDKKPGQITLTLVEDK